MRCYGYTYTPLKPPSALLCSCSPFHGCAAFMRWFTMHPPPPISPSTRGSWSWTKLCLPPAKRECNPFLSTAIKPRSSAIKSAGQFSGSLAFENEKQRERKRGREASSALFYPRFVLTRVCICVSEQRKGKSKPRLCFSRTCFNVIVVRIFTLHDIKISKTCFRREGGGEVSGRA